MKYRLIMPTSVQETIAHLSPNSKRQIRAALEMITEDPHLGKPLRDNLADLRSFRVNRYRIVYRIHHSKIEVQVIDIALRSIIYERVWSLIRMRSPSD